MDYKLSDSLALFKVNRFFCIKVDENDLEFTTVVSINETGSIDDRQPALKSKAASRLNKTRIPIGQSDSKTRRDKTTLKGS